MSFLEYLQKKGYTYEEANSICISVENDLPLPKDQEDLYWIWWNKELKKFYFME